VAVNLPAERCGSSALSKRGASPPAGGDGRDGSSAQLISNGGNAGTGTSLMPGQGGGRGLLFGANGKPGSVWPADLTSSPIIFASTT
jgi:hypothetical protein